MELSYSKAVHSEVKKVYKENTFLAIIPARGGSKGIAKKNLVKVKGRPLIAYTIEPALKSRYIDRIIVSTDDVEISRVSKEYGAEVPFLRPNELATDEAKTIEAVLYTLEQLKESYDYVVLLQPTQPLRTTEQIDAAIEQIIDEKQENLVSVELLEKNPIMFREIVGEGVLQPLLKENSTVRRQDFKSYYYVNGLIYINQISTLSNTTSLNDNKFAYVTEPTIDIDTMEDLKRFIDLIE